MTLEEFDAEMRAAARNAVARLNEDEFNPRYERIPVDRLRSRFAEETVLNLRAPSDAGSNVHLLIANAKLQIYRAMNLSCVQAQNDCDPSPEKVVAFQRQAEGYVERVTSWLDRYANRTTSN